ncbi:MAG: protoheme IX farnesyltransferase [Desulfuromonas sp.]|uniref:protoheme IX farnesyltransferase n=1 Tax=Desulfuromonas sp. TaxID=892 RepID=UPI000CC242C5|nr:protoheme IX farnesyltransferase [Desulfuromonas sp.]PLX86764.1 MAG: protoheme IX farnesyltransferase [Desulfuromonas sp.]
MSAAIAASGLVGYAFFPAPTGNAAPALTGGLFLLAAGGSVFNQVLERDTDALMERTRNRPLPAGRISPRASAVWGTALLTAGTAALGVGLPPAVAALGLLGIGIYLGLYTPLKRRTPLALLAGALCGALPPLMGWLVAGGHPSDHPILLLCGLLYLWQIPHFLQRAWTDREDLRGAGMANLFDHLPPERVRRLILLWCLALSATTLQFPAFALLEQRGPFLAALIGAVGLAAYSAWNWRCADREAPPPSAAPLHFFLLLMMTSLAVNGMLSRLP